MLQPDELAELRRMREYARANGLDFIELMDRNDWLASRAHDTKVRLGALDRLAELLEPSNHLVSVHALLSRLPQPVESTPANLMRGLLDWVEQVKREKP